MHGETVKFTIFWIDVHVISRHLMCWNSIIVFIIIIVNFVAIVAHSITIIIIIIIILTYLLHGAESFLRS